MDFPGIDYGAIGAAVTDHLLSGFGLSLEGALRASWEPVRKVLMLYLAGTTDVTSGNPGDFVKNPVIRHWMPVSVGLADAGLAASAIWGAYHLMFAHGARSLYSVRILLPRLLLAAILINWAGWLIQQVIGFENQLSGVVVAGPPPIDIRQLQAPPQNQMAPLDMVVVALLFGAYAVLAIAYSVRYALLVLLAILAPLAGLLFVLPDTHHYARAWGALFVTALFMQPLQLLILQVGHGLEVQDVPYMREASALAAVWICFKVPGALHDTSTVAGHAISQLKHVAHQVTHVPVHRS